MGKGPRASATWRPHNLKGPIADESGGGVPALSCVSVEWIFGLADLIYTAGKPPPGPPTKGGLDGFTGPLGILPGVFEPAVFFNWW